MKKSVKLLSLFAMLAGFSTVAAAEGVFVGGSLDLQHSKIKNTLCDNDEGCSAKDGRLGIGLKTGYDFGQFRVYGAYQYNPKAKETHDETHNTPNFAQQVHEELQWQSHDITVGADYTPSFTENFKGLVGGYMGYSHAKITDKYHSSFTDSTGRTYTHEDSSSKGSNGFVYGLRLGGIYSFNQNNELEFGIKAEQAKYKKVDDGDWYFKNKITNYGAFVGYNYKF